MRIALNATPLLFPLTGIGQYTYQLAKGLQTTPKLSLDFFYSTSWSKTLRNKPVNHIVKASSLFKKIVPNPYATRRLIQQYNFNKGIKANNTTVYHEPSFLPFQFKGPTLLTVHDLSWIRFPETHPVERVNIMNKHFEKGLRSAQRIITDSEFVKSELIDVFGMNPNLIQSIPLGVENLFHPRSMKETQAVLTRHQLVHGQYLLSVGTLEPRKNLTSTLRAFMQLPSALRQRFPLLIAGMSGWNTSSLEKQLAPLIHAGEIRQLGYVPREELAIIMSGALTLIYPSIYEGFGLPPLEAMASGVPVIASNISSLPEVVGDTGFLIDPHDVDALKKSIETMITAPDVRLNLSEKALSRSADFSWEHCVRQTVEVYRGVM
jgi:glycosyltransferase involved in cell wall biosynthesis